ncbi:hypothetical protein HWV62_33865 [Athelia sp. TMB]|nr:hypothetical protein HWV62_33865 [Athelia sp. TMB]
MPQEFPWYTYKKWSEELNSDIIHLNVLGTSIIILSSVEAIGTLFDGKAAIYSDRPKSTMISELMGWQRLLPLMPYGPLWRSHRKAFHQEFHPQVASRHHPKEIKATHELLRRLLASPRDWYRHIKHQAGAVIMDVAYGIEVLPENDPYIKTAEAAMGALNDASIPGAFLVDMIPLLKYVPAGVPGAGFQRKAEEGRQAIDDLIAVPYTAMKKDMVDGNAKPSFASRSLAAMDATGKVEEKEDIIRKSAAMVYAGGSDSTPSTIHMFILAMVTNPEVQAKAHAELDSVLGKSQLPTFTDKASLPYITAVVKETFRWEPVAPLSLPRQVLEDDEYRGYRIPKGSIIIQNSWAVLHDENTYPDPLAFKPERFLRDGQLDTTVQDPDVVSFGSGRRICPGKSMGYDYVWLNIASILATFDINRPTDPDSTTVAPRLEPFGITGNYPVDHVCAEDAQPYALMEVLQAVKAQDTEELHQQISLMSLRIQQLEDALALIQSSVSLEKHPLLRDELLLIKYSPERHPSVESDVPENPFAAPVDAFGTLTIGDEDSVIRGLSSYLSRDTPVSLCGTIQAASEPEGSVTKQQGIPDLLHNLASMFLMGSRSTTGPEIFENAMTLLFTCLPALPRAWSLCETFLEQASWLFRPIQREELIQSILTPVYAAREGRENEGYVTTTEVSPHKLSILFSVFALGGLVDLTLPAFSDEGERHHQCARAALALRSIFDSPMVETVQAILLLAYYSSNSPQRYTQDSIWILTSVGSKVAQSVNRNAYAHYVMLYGHAHTFSDRDPAQWNMDEKTAERRRALFWEIYSADMFHSLSLGRPPAIGLSYVDCALPRVGSDSDPEAQFWNWKYKFNRNIFGSVLEMTLAAKSPDYKTILEFDQKVREMPLPHALNVFLKNDDDEISLNVYMKGSYLSMVRSVTLLYIHKSYFAQALLDHPDNPLLSPYATSFLAATRWWTLWAHLFSAAMMAGLLVTRAPSSTMAPAAFTELAVAVELFERGAKLSSRVHTGMDILHRLQEKASKLFGQQHGGAELPDQSSSIIGSMNQVTDELAIFSGQTRGLLGKSPGVMTQMSTRTSLLPEPMATPDASARALGDDQSTPTVLRSDIEPSLMEHVALLPSGISAEIDWNAISEALSQPLATAEVPIFDSDTSAQDCSSFETSTHLSLERDGSFANFFNISASVDPLQRLYTEALEANMWGPGDVEGSAINSSSKVDEDWAMFMKESGFV